jgi:hypothetical protein
MSDGPMRNRVARGLAVAVAGLFAGHVLIYRIVAPDALQRAVLLNGTGHAYLPLAVALGLIFASVAGAGAFALGFRRATGRGAGGRRRGLGAALIVPAIAQAVAFLALETLERALAGAPMGSLLGPLLPVGVALQLLVGAIGGLVLVGLDRAGEMTGRAVTGRWRPVRRSTPVPIRLSAIAAPTSVAAGSGIIRGPPLPS